MVLYENDVEVVSLESSAVGTNNLDWFSRANLISSPWLDLKTAPAVNFGLFGVRNFEVTGPYVGCNTEKGWLLVTNQFFCSWDDRAPKPSIQYSKLATASFMIDYGT